MGYAAHPEICLDLLLGEDLVKGFVLGNHNHYVISFQEKADEIRLFVNDYAFAGIKHACAKMTPDHLAAMSSWPKKLVIEDLGLSLSHSSFADDSFGRYVFRGSDLDAEEELNSCPTDLCAIGHTHSPYVYSGDDWFISGDEIPVLGKGVKTLINVGSVGQPRDRDPRACYGLLTFGKEVRFQFRRVVYDIDEAARYIKMVNLPDLCWERLFGGE